MAADATVPLGQGHAAETAGGPAEQVVMHTAEEAARLLRVKRSWLERQAAARKIPFAMLGGSYRFSDRHLAEIVRMNEVAPAQPAADVPRPRRDHRKARPGGEPCATVAPLRPRPHKPRADPESAGPTRALPSRLRSQEV